MYKKYFTIIVGLFAYANATAQCSGMLDSAKQELLRINKTFDASSYLGFDLSVLYFTDSCTMGCSQHDAKTISYQLNSKNYYYSTGSDEYIQNDSFTVQIDHTDKTMIVTKNTVNEAASNFMLKDFVNYSLNEYDSVFTICITDIDSITRKLRFVASSPLSPYDSLVIDYDIESYQPQKIEASLREKLELIVPPTGTQSGHTDSLHQFISMNFLNYKSIPTGKIFDETTYFIKNRATNRYLPADKYKYYEFITAGLDEDELEYSPQLLKDNSNNQ